MRSGVTEVIIMYLLNFHVCMSHLENFGNANTDSEALDWWLQVFIFNELPDDVFFSGLPQATLWIASSKLFKGRLIKTQNGAGLRKKESDKCTECQKAMVTLFCLIFFLI